MDLDLVRSGAKQLEVADDRISDENLSPAKIEFQNNEHTEENSPEIKERTTFLYTPDKQYETELLKGESSHNKSSLEK